MRIYQFETARLCIRSWKPVIKDMQARRSLEADLVSILTRPVLEHLPPTFHLGNRGAEISSWIDARAAESDVLLVQSKPDGGLVGLMILVPDANADGMPGLHIGYLLAEPVWGQGFASELVKGLLLAVRSDWPVRLFAGVGTGNIASARVLQKAGFMADLQLSTADTDVYVRSVD